MSITRISAKDFLDSGFKTFPVVRLIPLGTDARLKFMHEMAEASDKASMCSVLLDLLSSQDLNNLQDVKVTNYISSFGLDTDGLLYANERSDYPLPYTMSVEEAMSFQASVYNDLWISAEKVGDILDNLDVIPEAPKKSNKK
jgi:hypothetical protein